MPTSRSRVNPRVAYRVAGTGAFHLAESGHVSLEDVHLLHQGGESRLCGFAHLLINTFGLGKNINAPKHDFQQALLEVIESLNPDTLSIVKCERPS